jgi:hypothetical protein
MPDFYSLAQGKHCNNQEYYDELNSFVLTAEESGATIGAHPAGVIEILSKTVIDQANPTNGERTCAIKSTVERYLAVAFLLGANLMRYGTLFRRLVHTQLAYPKHTIICAIIPRRDPKTEHGQRLESARPGIYYYWRRPQQLDENCRRCGADGHTSTDCNTRQEKVDIF